jgi:hypothetical protein
MAASQEIAHRLVEQALETLVAGCGQLLEKVVEPAAVEAPA